MIAEVHTRGVEASGRLPIGQVEAKRSATQDQQRHHRGDDPDPHRQRCRRLDRLRHFERDLVTLAILLVGVRDPDHLQLKLVLARGSGCRRIDQHAVLLGPARGEGPLGISLDDEPLWLGAIHGQHARTAFQRLDAGIGHREGDLGLAVGVELRRRARRRNRKCRDRWVRQLAPPATD